MSDFNTTKGPLLTLPSREAAIAVPQRPGTITMMVRSEITHGHGGEECEKAP
jgi:hypothetical protein